MSIYKIADLKTVSKLTLQDKIKRKVFYLQLIKTYDKAYNEGIELEDITEFLSTVITYHDLELMTIKEVALFREHDLCEPLTEYFDPDDLYAEGYLGEEDYRATKEGFDY
jgi:hypothetical protein